MTVELLHVDNISYTHDLNTQGRTMKQLFGSIKDFDELVDTFVFYMPVVHYLVQDSGRTKLPTDIVSNTLAQILKEHPLVITDLPRAVFRFEEDLIVPSDIKPITRTLYAVPKEVWTQVVTRLNMLTVFDRLSHRFCVLALCEHTIPNPIGKNSELSLPVKYFNCYGNRETFYFEPSDNAVPMLKYHLPIEDFVAFADRFLQHLQVGLSGSSEESLIQKACQSVDHDPYLIEALAIQKQNKLHTKIATPLGEKQLDARYIGECREIIKFYESVFNVPGA